MIKVSTYLFSLLLVFATAMSAEAAFSKLRLFKNASTATGITCSVVGGDRIAVGEVFVPKPSSARSLFLGTKNTGYKNYSASLTDSYILVSCYETVARTAAQAWFIFDNNTSVSFPITEKFLKPQ